MPEAACSHLSVVSATRALWQQGFCHSTVYPHHLVQHLADSTPSRCSEDEAIVPEGAGQDLPTTGSFRMQMHFYPFTH